MRVAASLEQAAALDRRRYARQPVRVSAGLLDNARPSSPVTVVDLSPGGCGIETGMELAVGARVWLKLPGLESWPSRVAWHEPGRAGLSFERAMHEGVVARFA